MDCYSDPLGWKDLISQSETDGKRPIGKASVTVFKSVKNVDKLLSSVLDLGRGAASQANCDLLLRYNCSLGLFNDLVTSICAIASRICWTRQVQVCCCR